MDLRSHLQRIALQWPAYGYRRVHVELRKRGWEVNHKRVLRLMRADNLLCLRRRKFILTTDSKHALRIYPNLAKDMVLTRINQLWVADITYIRLQGGVRVLGGSAGCLFTTLHRLGPAAQQFEKGLCICLRGTVKDAGNCIWKIPYLPRII